MTASTNHRLPRAMERSLKSMKSKHFTYQNSSCPPLKELKIQIIHFIICLEFFYSMGRFNVCKIDLVNDELDGYSNWYFR